MVGAPRPHRHVEAGEQVAGRVEFEDVSGGVRLADVDVPVGVEGQRRWVVVVTAPEGSQEISGGIESRYGTMPAIRGTGPMGHIQNPGGVERYAARLSPVAVAQGRSQCPVRAAPLHSASSAIDHRCKDISGREPCIRDGYGYRSR